MASKTILNLDHRAGGAHLPEVAEAMKSAVDQPSFSRRSVHRFGVQAKDVIARCHGQVRTLLGVSEEFEITLGSGLLEVVNLGILGYVLANERKGRHILASVNEHPVVEGCLRWLEGRGFEVSRVGLDGQGRVRIDELENQIRQETLLICLHLSDSDLGTIQSTKMLFELSSRYGKALFLEGDCFVGLESVDLDVSLPIFLAFSLTRIGAPSGVGALVYPRMIPFEPILHEGRYQVGIRSESLTPAGVIGFGVAAEVAHRERGDWQVQLGKRETEFIEALLDGVPNTMLLGPVEAGSRLWGHINMVFEFVEGHGLALRLDTQGLLVGTGSICDIGRNSMPPSLEAIHLPPSLGKSNLIFTLGCRDQSWDVKAAVSCIQDSVAFLREMSLDWESYLKGSLQSRVERRN